MCYVMVVVPMFTYTVKMAISDLQQIPPLIHQKAALTVISIIYKLCLIRYKRDYGGWSLALHRLKLINLRL